MMRFVKPMTRSRIITASTFFIAFFGLAYGCGDHPGTIESGPGSVEAIVGAASSVTNQTHTMILSSIGNESLSTLAQLLRNYDASLPGEPWVHDVTPTTETTPKYANLAAFFAAKIHDDAPPSDASLRASINAIFNNHQTQKNTVKVPASVTIRLVDLALQPFLEQILISVAAADGGSKPAGGNLDLVDLFGGKQRAKNRQIDRDQTSCITELAPILRNVFTDWTLRPDKAGQKFSYVRADTPAGVKLQIEPSPGPGSMSFYGGTGGTSLNFAIGAPNGDLSGSTYNASDRFMYSGDTSSGLRPCALEQLQSMRASAMAPQAAQDPGFQHMVTGLARDAVANADQD